MNKLFYAKERSQWREWLNSNFETESEIWFVFSKVGTPEKGVSYNDAVEEALCFGWIDGRAGKLDSDHYVRRFTPRRKGSSYSRLNIERLVKLDGCGMIHPKVRDSVLPLIAAADAGRSEYLIINPLLRRYIESSIIPLYDHFDKGHQRDHVRYVIDEALRLASHYDVDPDIIFAAAAYHDTGLREDRQTHHLVSASIIRADLKLREYFTEEQINTISDAAEDHRASSDHEPRTIYGKIIAEADRQIIPETVIRRTIQFGLKNHPDLDMEGHWQRTVGHLQEKYAEGGYLKLWIPQSPNAARLEHLRGIIRDKAALRGMFEQIYNALKAEKV